MSEGYWHKPYGGDPEWRDAPRCKCGGKVETRQIREMDEAEEHDTVGDVFCLSCGAVQVTFVKPSAAAIQRGRELAKKYGW